jgi:hypothetical protein
VPSVDVSGHRLFAAMTALLLYMESKEEGGIEWREARIAHKALQRFYDKYAQTVLIRYKGRQISLIKAGGMYTAWLARKKSTRDYREHYEFTTLGTQIHEGHIIKMRLDGLTEEVLTFHGKLPDLVNSAWPK